MGYCALSGSTRVLSVMYRWQKYALYAVSWMGLDGSDFPER